MTRPAWLRWPLMWKRDHELISQAIVDRLDSAVAAIRQEHARATREGRAQVHKWAVEANYSVATAINDVVARSWATAAFQEAEQQFAPDPNPIGGTG